MLETARELTSLIESEATAAEAAGQMTQPVVDAFTDAGLFALMVPKVLGGTEADIVTTLEVLEEVCRADGSTGWSLLANVTSTAFAAAYCSDAAVAEMFNGELPPVHAGQFAPRGTASKVDGGYRVAGRYSFASGSDHAGYLAGGAIDGDGRMIAVFVPKDRAVLLGNWDVLGLAATHSVDYEIPEQVIDAGWTFPLLDAQPLRSGATYRLGVLSITAVGHCAFALGVGRRALEEIIEIARRKHRMGADPIREQQIFQHDLALHDAALLSARSFSYDVFDEAQATVESGSVPTTEQGLRLRQATTYATRVAADATRFAYTWAGSDALRNPSVLGRCYRDMAAGTQHLFVDNSTLTQTAQLLLG